MDIIEYKVERRDRKTVTIIAYRLASNKLAINQETRDGFFTNIKKFAKVLRDLFSASRNTSKRLNFFPL